MITTKRSAISRNLACPLGTDSNVLASDHTGRLIQIALALYLMPALLVVLTMGVVGIIMLAVSRLFMGPVRRPVA
jgi:hypothetical protein